MENPSDDPRHFAHDDVGLAEDILPGMDTFSRVSWLQIINEFIRAVSLQTLMDRGMRQNAQTSTRSTIGPSVISDYF